MLCSHRLTGPEGGALPLDLDHCERSVVEDSNPMSPGPSKGQSWQIPVALASVLMGVLVSLQFRNQRDFKPTANKQSELIALIKNLEQERDRLSQELQGVRTQLSEAQANQGGQANMAKQLLELRMQAGLTAMKGQGVTIRLADSNRKPGPDEDSYFFIVHDQDLQALTNELFAAGAEAVSINDQRIITRTSIRCVGPSVLVNTVQLASPFEVKAIGPPKELEGGLHMPNGWEASMAMLIRSGGEIKINSAPEVIIPAFSGSSSFRHAQPVPDDAQESASTHTGGTVP